MATERDPTFHLDEEDAAFVHELVRSGTYVSASEVVHAGLAALRGQVLEVPAWLRAEVATYLEPSPSSELEYEQSTFETSSEYDAWLTCKVEAARESIRAGRTYSGEEVEFFFAKLRAATLVKLGQE
jgi:putative addiction module CopG family antidote